MSIEGINGQPLKGVQAESLLKDLQSDKLNKSPAADSQTSFEDVLSRYLEDVNKTQQTADESIRQLANGENTSIQDVVTKLNEADIAFQMMKEVRNKLVEAYKEVMNMSG